jgi:hypothetical protein
LQRAFFAWAGIRVRTLTGFDFEFKPSSRKRPTATATEEKIALFVADGQQRRHQCIH